MLAIDRPTNDLFDSLVMKKQRSLLGTSYIQNEVAYYGVFCKATMCMNTCSGVGLCSERLGAATAEAASGIAGEDQVSSYAVTPEPVGSC